MHLESNGELVEAMHCPLIQDLVQQRRVVQLHLVRQPHHVGEVATEVEILHDVPVHKLVIFQSECQFKNPVPMPKSFLWLERQVPNSALRQWHKSVVLTRPGRIDNAPSHCEGKINFNAVPEYLSNMGHVQTMLYLAINKYCYVWDNLHHAPPEKDHPHT